MLVTERETIKVLDVHPEALFIAYPLSYLLTPAPKTGGSMVSEVGSTATDLMPTEGHTETTILTIMWTPVPNRRGC